MPVIDLEDVIGFQKGDEFICRGCAGEINEIAEWEPIRDKDDSCLYICDVCKEEV